VFGAFCVFRGKKVETEKIQKSWKLAAGSYFILKSDF
jgi:hypothetical protein